MKDNAWEAKLSSKNQIVIPRKVRDALHVKAGDRIVLVVRGDTVILLAKPRKYSEAIHGIGKGVYPADYLKNERESWQ